jgi:DNA-binding transcriptional MerR regulator
VNARTYLSIGQVLDLLKQEFPDLTISKIRFLESQGLLDPERTPSGYRKFYDPDVDRLRFILRAQQDQYLPLKVIRGRLGSDGAAEGVDAGDDAEPGGASDTAGGASDTAGGPVGAGGSRVLAASTRRPTTAAPGVLAGMAPVAVGPAPAADSSAASGEAAASIGSAASVGSATSVGPRGTGSRTRGIEAVIAGPGEQSSGQDLDVAASRHPSVSGTASSRVAPPTSATPAVGLRAVGPAAAPPIEEADEPPSLTLEELAAVSGLTAADLSELERFGLLTGRRIAGTTYYDTDCATIAAVAARFRAFGVEARHLRMYRTAVEREAGFFEQVVTPMLKQRNPQARRQAVETLLEMSRLGSAMREAVLRLALREYTGGT